MKETTFKRRKDGLRSIRSKSQIRYLLKMPKFLPQKYPPVRNNLSKSSIKNQSSWQQGIKTNPTLLLIDKKVEFEARARVKVEVEVAVLFSLLTNKRSHPRWCLPPTRSAHSKKE